MQINTIIFDFYGVILKNIKENILLGKREMIPYEDTIKFIRSIPVDYTIAIGSASNTLLIKEALEIFRLIDHFDVIIGASDVANQKPNPEVYQKVLQKLNKKTNEAIVIEDSPQGVKAAKNAGIKCVALMNSYQRRDLIEADLIVKNLSGITLEELLDKLSNNL